MSASPTDERRKRIRRIRTLSSLALFPLLIFYYEMVLHKLTVKEIDRPSFVYILLFSISLGFILYLFRSILPFRRLVIVTELLIFLLMLPYLVEMFVFRKFNIFYDINTIKGGAGGVATGFMGDVFRMVFSLGGLVRLFFLFFPLYFYPRALARFDRRKHLNLKKSGILFLSAVLVFFSARGLIYLNDTYAAGYQAEYNYGSAVSAYGLLTGMRLDIKYSKKGAGDFVNMEAVNWEEDLKMNVLDIDFKALSETDEEPYASIDAYVAAQKPGNQNEYTGLFKGKNLIFFTAEAFSGDLIDEELTPTLYRMANKGIQFTDYYVPASAGTTGGEYENIFGLLPMTGGSSMKDTASFCNYFTMGNQLDRLGYTGYAFHNNSYTFYDRHKTHINLGYSEGFMGYGNGMEKYVSKSWPQSDKEMLEGTIELYLDRQPFNVYYMTVSGHSDYSVESNDMSDKNWKQVVGLPYSNRVKAYIAANLELENALTHLINRLDARGILNDTVIVLSADHFPYGLDDDASLGNMVYLSELYGHNVNDYLDRDHNRLIIWSGCLEDKEEPIVVDSPVSCLDILPTLSNLFGTEYDSRLFIGRDVFSDAEPLVFDANYNWKTEKGTYLAKQGFTQNVGEIVSDDYINQIKSVVRNKINYSKSLLEVDYYGHIMGIEKSDDTLESESESPSESESESETEAKEE